MYNWKLFTILLQDEVPTLQILNADNEWIQATPIKNIFVVNMADSLMRSTKELFQSTVYRAINILGRKGLVFCYFGG